MFCSNCGNKIKEGAVFCTQCGKPVEGISENSNVPVQNVPVQNMPMENVPMQSMAASTVSPSSEVKEKKKISKWKIIAPVVCVAACALIAAGVGFFMKQSKIQNVMNQAANHMEERDYDEAIDYYKEVLDYNAEHIDAKLALAKAYLCQGKMEKAEDWLDEVDLKKGDERKAEFERLSDLLELDPVLNRVNTDAFPMVTAAMSQESDVTLTADNFVVKENGEEKEILEVTQEEGITYVTYLTTDTEINGEERALSMEITVDDVVFPREYNYTTPVYSEAEIALVSTDVSQYPKVKAYFRVTDKSTGENISDLTGNSFTIQESLQGGEYLNREVKSATLLDDNAGLNINLVADKSDSISDEDMQKIKTVMIEFVSSLQYAVGDKAELLAFDSIVQQMCYYTDDVDLLINGINNMSTDGLTAFYDAIYDGISHASLQGGARCVIAFTDGADNQSIHNYSEVISYACEKQVPVYIIGVGYYVEESTLEYIAESTGGRYWFIDDLHDLEQIFNQVYSEQKELYVVEYESDASLDSYLTRDLQVKVSGSGYRCTKDLSFTPVRSINDNGGINRTSRYELIKECLTWEEASQRCQEMGGHLATITSQEEMDELVAMAEAQDVKYVWLGGYTSYDDYGNVFGHWVTGESFSYQAWSVGEPSRVDMDGVEEWYIMLWNIPSLGGWTWNDQRNDPASAVVSMQESMGFICEFEN